MKASTNFYATTQLGKQIFEDQILSLVPSHIFSTALHIETCVIIAESQRSFSGDRKKVYINLLVRKSKKARILTALRFVDTNKMLALKEIHLYSNIGTAFESFFSVPIQYIKNSPNFLIDSPSKSVLTAKYIYHSIYRIIGWKLKWKTIKNNSIVRSFVEVTERIHKDRLKSSLCLFFPFPYKFSRQLAFYKACKEKKYQTAFMGVPYSLKNLITILLKRTDSSIVDFEFEAHYKHGIELSKLNLKHYYTEDDYDASAFLIANELMKNGCEVINTAHGVNQTCPYVNCNVFEVLTRPQYDFYSSFQHTKHISFKFQKKDSISSSCSLEKNRKTVFVFVHGNFKESQIIYESQLQSKIVSELEKNIDSYNVFIKYHPNGYIFESTNIPVLESFDDLNNRYNIVFMTMNSTTFFSHYHLGCFIFLGDDFCNPYTLVDKDVPFFHYQQVEKLLQDYSNAEFFTSKMQEQYNLINRIQNGLFN